MSEPIYVDMFDPEQRARFDAATPCNRLWEEDTKRFGYYEDTPERREDLRQFFAQQAAESKKSLAEGKKFSRVGNRVVLE